LTGDILLDLEGVIALVAIGRTEGFHGPAIGDLLAGAQGEQRAVRLSMLASGEYFSNSLPKSWRALAYITLQEVRCLNAVLRDCAVELKPHRTHEALKGVAAERFKNFEGPPLRGG
jgi:hypothetical protein